jgi:protein subunit release factor A
VTNNNADAMRITTCKLADNQHKKKREEENVSKKRKAFVNIYQFSRVCENIT